MLGPCTDRDPAAVALALGKLAADDSSNRFDRRTSLCDVSPGFLDVGPSRWGRPYVPAWFRLGDLPSFGLLHLMASTATRASVAGVRLPAFVVGDSMFEI